MKLVKGSLWSAEFDGYLKVVPINLGWKSSGANVMGRGVAKQAAAKFPDLAMWFGQVCKDMASADIVKINRYSDLLMFPVKPLFKTAPHLSWQRDADFDLVERSARELASLLGSNQPIVLPLVGCGNGGLSPCDVLPMLFRLLRSDRFTLVLTPLDYGRWKQIIKGLM